MTSFSVFSQQESQLNLKFRGLPGEGRAEWSRKHSRERAEDIPADAEEASLRREKFNYRGLGSRQKLKTLIAGNVDQPFLEEIGKLKNLEWLELEYPFVATDLAPLLQLKSLRHLKIDSPRKITNFQSLLELPALEALFLENAKHLADLEWLRSAHHLSVIGIEGGMWTRQRVPSLQPIAGLRGLQAFFGTSLRVADKDLMPLAACPKLEFIGIAATVPRSEFERLHAARPDIICSWFRSEPWDEMARLRGGSA